MHLEVITPDQKVYQGEASAVTFPGSDGSFEVLNNHAPMIAALATGNLVIRSQTGEKTIHIEGGMVEVLRNTVTVLAEKISK